jgi:hypothetical protein
VGGAVDDSDPVSIVVVDVSVSPAVVYDGSSGQPRRIVPTQPVYRERIRANDFDLDIFSGVREENGEVRSGLQNALEGDIFHAIVIEIRGREQRRIHALHLV